MFASPLDAALRYASIGWPVFPCGENKHPLTASGYLDASVDPAVIARWWASKPNAHVAVACGPARLAVIDLDYDPAKSKDGPSAWKVLCEQHGRDLCGLIATSPRGGRHLFYQMPDDAVIRCRVDILPKSGIDVRGEGGYVLLPSPASPGREWRAGDPFDVDGDGVGDCGPMPGWVRTLLAVTSEQRAGGSSAGGVSHTVTPLSADAVRSIRSALAVLDSDPHDVWLRVGMALKSTGAWDQAYEIWCEWSQTSAKFEPKQQRRRWNSFKEFRFDGSEITLGTLFHLAREAGWQPQMELELAAEVVQPEPDLHQSANGSAPPTSDRESFPRDLLDSLPGVVGEMARWMLRSSPRRQPALCLASAIVSVGALLGRRVQTPTGLRTNVYALGIAETASGKGVGIKLPTRLFVAAGVSQLIGPSEWKSDAGLRAALADDARRSQVCLVDEFTKFLQAVSGPRAAGHQLGIKRSLLELFSCADGTWLPAAYADTKLHPAVPLAEPHLCVYGTGVPSELFASMDRGAVSDGFLNRILVFFADEQMPVRQKIHSSEPPIELVEAVRDLERRTRRVGDLHGVCRTVAFSGRADALLDQILDLSDARVRDYRASAHPALADLWVRFGEHVAKLALLRSVSADPTAEVDVADVEWAEQVVGWTFRRLSAEAEDRIADSASEAATLRVRRIVREAGPLGLTLADLTRRTQWLRRSERKDVLASLVEAGDVTMATEVSGSSGGRPRTTIVASS